MNAHQTFEQIARTLAQAEAVRLGRMFGVQTITVNGKAFASFQGDAMIFKLEDGSDRHAAALALDGARHWDPLGQGMKMKEWVQVPFDHAALWPDLADQALAYAALGA